MAETDMVLSFFPPPAAAEEEDEEESLRPIDAAAAAWDGGGGGLGCGGGAREMCGCVDVVPVRRVWRIGFDARVKWSFY